MARPLKVFLAGRVAVESSGHVLGEQHFPGRQGRLLFAYLVAEQGRAVPKDELAEVLWNGSPPPSWSTALTVLVSKLRALLAEIGIDGASALSGAFGCYRLDLPDGSTVDVLEAEDAAQKAESLLAAEEWAQATSSAALAESLLRQSFIPGEDGAWVEAKRRELAEVRARALSVLAEACLGSGNPLRSVRWAEQAIEAEPFRESGYRRLMEAHAAAGDRAEALRVYERCRRLLAEELGAYPSPETESIYRSLLDAPSGGVVTEIEPTTSPPGSAPPPANRPRHPAVVVAALLILVAVVAAGVAITVAATRSDGGQGAPAASMTRVALVVPLSPTVSDDPFDQYTAAVDRARSAYGVQTQTFPIDLSKPIPASVLKSIDSSDLVLLARQFVGARFVHEIARHPHTRFVVMDPDPSQTAGGLFLAVTKDPNATDIFFVEGPGAYLAGYLGALMAKERKPGKRPIVVSIVAGDSQVNMDPVTGFTTGATDAVPGVKVLLNYSHDFTHPSNCERIADRQINEGSTVVFADAGACGVGALSAAGERSVWGIGADQDMSNLGPQILASTVKRIDRAVDFAISRYLDGALPQGHLDIGIERDAVTIAIPPGVVPKTILEKVIRVQQEHMKKWTSMAMPLSCSHEVGTTDSYHGCHKS